VEKYDGDADQAEEAGRLTQVLDTIWNEVVLGDSKLSPEKSCFALADDYRHSGKTQEECAENFVGWQMAKAGAAGFALGLPGFAAMPITVPADFLSVAYLQLRMVAVIGLLFDWDVRSDQFRTMAYMSLLGSAAGELVRDLGIKATTRVAMGTIQKKVSGAVLQKINRTVGARLVTKAGSTGVVNLTKIVPVLGGLVGGGVNVLVTRQIGKTAISWLKEGPPPQDAGEPEAQEGGIIEGEIA
jgi:hypothetical protein